MRTSIVVPASRGSRCSPRQATTVVPFSWQYAILAPYKRKITLSSYGQWTTYKKFVGFAENVATLGVTDKSPCDAHVLKHIHTVLASESTRASGVYVLRSRMSPKQLQIFENHAYLGSDVEVGSGGLADLVEVDGRGGDVDFALGAEGIEAIDKLSHGGFGGSFASVELPVA